MAVGHGAAPNGARIGASRHPVCTGVLRLTLPIRAFKLNFRDRGLRRGFCYANSRRPKSQDLNFKKLNLAMQKTQMKVERCAEG